MYVYGPSFDFMSFTVAIIMKYHVFTDEINVNPPGSVVKSSEPPSVKNIS